MADIEYTIDPLVEVTVALSAPDRSDSVFISTSVHCTNEINTENAIDLATAHAVRQAKAAAVASRERD